MESAWASGAKHEQDAWSLNELIDSSDAASTPTRHDDCRGPIIVIGGSAGGIVALRALIDQLPLGFPASILVALHWPPRTLNPDRFIGGRLPVALATDGAVLQQGCITLARPDWHLLVDGERLRLTQSREEHFFRPAIDPLFRSAARAYGPRVVGVLLSGRNSDGTAGLLNVVLHGGVAIVQDPGEAEHTAMPQSALDNVPGARCLRLAAIAAALAEVTATTTRRPDERCGRPDVGHWVAPWLSGEPEPVRVLGPVHPSMVDGAPESDTVEVVLAG